LISTFSQLDFDAEMVKVVLDAFGPQVCDSLVRRHNEHIVEDNKDASSTDERDPWR